MDVQTFNYVFSVSYVYSVLTWARGVIKLAYRDFRTHRRFLVSTFNSPKGCQTTTSFQKIRYACVWSF